MCLILSSILSAKCINRVTRDWIFIFFHFPFWVLFVISAQHFAWIHRMDIWRKIWRWLCQGIPWKVCCRILWQVPCLFQRTNGRKYRRLSTDDSPFYEKVIAVQSVVASHFETTLFKKVCMKEAEELIKTSSGLPAIYLTGKYSPLHRGGTYPFLVWWL